MYLSHTRLYREYITSSEMYSLHLTHPKWTHTRSSGQPCYSAQGAVGGSVPCSRTPQSWYWGWRERWLFTPSAYNPCRTWDSNPQPLDYKTNSLTIRPRLPQTFETFPAVIVWYQDPSFHTEGYWGILPCNHYHSVWTQVIIIISSSSSSWSFIANCSSSSSGSSSRSRSSTFYNNSEVIGNIIQLQTPLGLCVDFGSEFCIFLRRKKEERKKERKKEIYDIGQSMSAFLFVCVCVYIYIQHCSACRQTYRCL